MQMVKLLGVKLFIRKQKVPNFINKMRNVTKATKSDNDKNKNNTGSVMEKVEEVIVGKDIPGRKEEVVDLTLGDELINCISI